MLLRSLSPPLKREGYVRVTGDILQPSAQDSQQEEVDKKSVFQYNSE